MVSPLRLFILAGEASGDRIGADLVRRLRHRVSLNLSGVGGDELEAEGIASLFPMSDLAVMGVSDVLLNLPKILFRLEQTARAILASRPDMVVLVDSQDFSRLLAQRLRRRGYSGPLILYVAPSVWARHPARAQKLNGLFDAVLAVLPFEPAVMQQLGGPPTFYVGHPALQEALDTTKAPESGPIMLLPGSRSGELKRHLPILRAAASRLAQIPGASGLVIPTLPRLRARLEDEVAQWAVPVEIVDRRVDRRGHYAGAIGAVCVSGTATLELALARVPMVVLYALDSHQAKVFAKLGQPPVSLPNIILGRDIVPELVQRRLAADALVDAATATLGDKKARQKQIDAFGELATIMAAGEPPHGVEDPADRVLTIWRDQRLSIGS